MNDPLLLWFVVAVICAVLFLGCFIGTVLMARQVVAECRRILRDADNRPHGDVPQLPAGWPGLKRGDTLRTSDGKLRRIMKVRRA